MPYIAEEGIVETFIIAYLSNSIKGLLRNSKTGVLLMSYLTLKLCIGRRASIGDARMSYSSSRQNLSRQVKC